MAEKVLVYRLGSIGDICVAIPSLRLTRARLPNATIALLTNVPVANKAAPAEALLKGSGLIDKYYKYPIRTRNPRVLLSLLWRLRRERFDTIINLAAWRGKQAAYRDAIFFRLLGARKMLGFARTSGDGDRSTFDSLVVHEAHRLLRRVSEFGTIDIDNVLNRGLALSASEIEDARQLLKVRDVPTDFLALSVGTKNPANIWPIERWCRMVSILGRDYPGLGCVGIGSADECREIARCLNAWPGPTANLCGECSPRESAAVISLGRLLIGHDSGPIHLASAVGTSCLGIYSARNPPGQWFPLGTGNVVIYHKTDCFGCGLEKCVEQKMRCITSISVEEVVLAARNMLRAGVR